MKKKTKSHMLIEIKKLKDMRKNKSHLPKKKKRNRWNHATTYDQSE